MVDTKWIANKVGRKDTKLSQPMHDVRQKTTMKELVGKGNA